MSRTDTATSLTDRFEPALERAGAVTAEARDRARAGAGIARERASEAASEARERAADVAERLEPTASRVAETTGTVVRRGIASAAVIPDVVGKVLEILSRLLSGLAEQGRGVAARIEPPKAQRRRSRLKIVGWFGAGFVAGTAAGWILHARSQEEPAPPYGYVDLDDREVSPYDDTAADIDARRHNTPVG